MVRHTAAAAAAVEERIVAAEGEARTVAAEEARHSVVGVVAAAVAGAAGTTGSTRLVAAWELPQPGAEEDSSGSGSWPEAASMRTVSVWAAPTWEAGDSSAVLLEYGASQHLAQARASGFPVSKSEAVRGREHTSRGRAAGTRWG